jgi:hypothetical protein
MTDDDDLKVVLRELISLLSVSSRLQPRVEWLAERLAALEVAGLVQVFPPRLVRVPN